MACLGEVGIEAMSGAAVGKAMPSHQAYFAVGGIHLRENLWREAAGGKFGVWLGGWGWAGGF